MATVRKLLMPHLHPNSLYEALLAQQPQPTRREQGWVYKFGSAHMDQIGPLLLIASGAVQHWINNIEGGGSQADSFLSSNSSSETERDQSKLHNQASSSGNNRAPVFNPLQLPGPAADIKKVTCTHNKTLMLKPLQKLQALLALTLVEMYHWRKGITQTPSADESEEVQSWWAVVCGIFEDASSPDFCNLGTLLLGKSSLSVSSPQAEINVAWERYAMTCFHGRLLPGCCYWRCQNLEEVTEAALRTQLCSGCRKARYCSKDCQKAAWLEGGHSKVCCVK